jgi:hypothetical protein
MRNLVVTTIALAILTASASGQTGLISDISPSTHKVAVANYPGDGYPGVSSEVHWSPGGLDGLNTGATASVAGSTATGVSRCGVPNGNTVVLTQSWEFSRVQGAPYGTATQTIQEILFTVDTDVAYTISGFYTTSDSYTEFQVGLLDYTPPATAPLGPFLSRHKTYDGTSFLTYEGTFLVGGEPLQYMSYLNGKSTGVLTAGHTYRLGTIAGSSNAAKLNAGQGYGDVTLTLTRLNSAPVADPGPAQTVHCDNATNGTIITLDCSGSYDPDGDQLEFVWSVAESSGVVIGDPNSSSTSAAFPRGVHEVTLTVYDLDELGERKGELDTKSVTITVIDDHPPTVMCTTSLAALSPANNKMVPVLVSVGIAEICQDPTDLSLRCTICSDQPDDTDGTGALVGDVDGQDGFGAPVVIELE